MDILLNKLQEYKNNNLSEADILNFVQDMINEYGIKKLEDRFVSLENIGNMLSFSEVTDAIYSKIPERVPVKRSDAFKMLFQKQPALDIDELVEEAIGRIKQLNDRKKLHIVKYRAIFVCNNDAETFTKMIKNICADKIDRIENTENFVTVYAVSDIWENIISICENNDLEIDLEQI